MGEDGSTPALCGRDSTWPPPGPAQAQLLKHHAEEGKTGGDLSGRSLISERTNMRPYQAEPELLTETVT